MALRSTEIAGRFATRVLLDVETGRNAVAVPTRMQATINLVLMAMMVCM
jgi:hypothetical protein